jgi:rod shape-determining protein MreC
VAVYRRSARPRYTLLLLALTSITMLTLDYRGAGSGVIGTVKDAARDAFAPVESASDRLFAPVGDFVGGVLHYGDLEAENARLRREVERLRGVAGRADDAERERRALLDQLNLEFVDDIPRVDARLVSTSPSNFELTVEIDKGTDAGVAKGMPVVSGAGLVGRVIQTSRLRSTVLLITDKASSVGVRLTSSNDVGVARGDGFRAPLEVDLIDVETPVRTGEVVVTSGLQQSVFPPGIPVGRVVAASAQPNALQQEVTIEPVVDLRRLAFLTVLQWSPR